MTGGLTITTVNLSAPDPLALATFYEQLLDWQITVAEDHWVLMRDPRGGVGLAFQWEEHYTRPVWPARPDAQDGQLVRIDGWLQNRRSSGKIHFLQVRDGSGVIQAVMSKAAVGEEMFRQADHLGQETALSVVGTVRADARAPGGYEIDAISIDVHSPSVDYPITPKEHGVDYLLDRRHLWIRSPRQQAILRVRHEVINAIRDYFNSRDFVLCDTPIFTPAACERTTTLFPVQYFEDTTAYLTQSGQLYNEANAMALGRVYCFGPTFRAEKSKTRRHLTEFWMVEPEMAYADLNDVIVLAEGLVAEVVGRVLDKRRQELKVLERDTTKLGSVLLR